VAGGNAGTLDQALAWSALAGDLGVTFPGITSSQVTVLTLVGAVVLAVLALLGRRLLFAFRGPEGGRRAHGTGPRCLWS